MQFVSFLQYFNNFTFKVVIFSILFYNQIRKDKKSGVIISYYMCLKVNVKHATSTLYKKIVKFVAPLTLFIF